jgi:hypothetical protein
MPRDWLAVTEPTRRATATVTLRSLPITQDDISPVGNAACCAARLHLTRRDTRTGRNRGTMTVTCWRVVE